MAERSKAQLNRMRHRAKQFMPALLAHQAGVCYWCPRTIVRRGEGYIEESPEYGCVNICGVRTRVYLATVDHIIAIRDGGTNDIQNLVACCAPCNRDRTANQRSTNAHKCKSCGGPKGRSGQSCVRCMHSRTAAWFAEHEGELDPIEAHKIRMKLRSWEKELARQDALKSALGATPPDT